MYGFDHFITELLLRAIKRAHNYHWLVVILQNSSYVTTFICNCLVWHLAGTRCHYRMKYSQSHLVDSTLDVNNDILPHQSTRFGHFLFLKYCKTNECVLWNLIWYTFYHKEYLVNDSVKTSYFVIGLVFDNKVLKTNAQHYRPCSSCIWQQCHWRGVQSWLSDVHFHKQVITLQYICWNSIRELYFLKFIWTMIILVMYIYILRSTVILLFRCYLW